MNSSTNVIETMSMDKRIDRVSMDMNFSKLRELVMDREA